MIVGSLQIFAWLIGFLFLIEFLLKVITHINDVQNILARIVCHPPPHCRWHSHISNLCTYSFHNSDQTIMWSGVPTTQPSNSITIYTCSFPTA